MSWTDIMVASLTVLVGSTLQGSVGFGMGLLASPILILIDQRFVPAPILLSTLCLTTLLTLRERHAIDVGGLRWAVAGRAAGTVFAATVLAVLPEDRMAVLFGALVLAGVGMSLSGLRLAPSGSVLVGAGALSAIMGTIAAVGGPPMALVYQDAPGTRIRGTMSGFFLIGTLLSLTALWVVGRFGMMEVYLALLLVPSLFVGFFVSRWTAGYVDRGYTRAAVLTVAGLAGFLVIVRQVV